MPVRGNPAQARGLVFAVLLALSARAAIAAENAGAAVNGKVVAGTIAPASQWRRAELYFGVGVWQESHAGRTEKRWQAFLDREVTPRFPDGFTVLDAYGQWRPSNTAPPSREHSKMLVIVFEESAQHRAALEQIRAAWKRLSGDQSVLLVVTPVDVSF